MSPYSNLLSTFRVKEHTFQKAKKITKICLVFFIGLMKYSNLLRYRIDGFLLNVSQNHHN